MIKKWNEKLEKIFNASNQDLALLESSQTFELNSDNLYLENLSYIYTNPLQPQNLQSIFSQLSPFFELGFLLEKQKSNYTPTQMFAYGQLANIADKNILIKLPTTPIFTIVRTSAVGILKRMNFSFLNSQNKMSAFVISVSPTLSILIVTKIEDPWLKLRLESLQKTLMKVSF